MQNRAALLSILGHVDLDSPWTGRGDAAAPPWIFRGGRSSRRCLGNHEADIGLEALARRCGEFSGTILNSNVPGAVDGLPERAVFELPCGSKVGLLGLLTSEDGVFRGNTFRGLAIRDVTEAAREGAAALREEEGCARVVALRAVTKLHGASKMRVGWVPHRSR